MTNDQTSQIIEQIAQKLGTTSQYLWGVLIKQAPIDATVLLIQTLLIVALGVVLLKLHRKFSDRSKGDSMYYLHEEALVIPMLIGALFFTVLSIVCFTCIGNIVNGYFNPEYWALHNILESVK